MNRRQLREQIFKMLFGLEFHGPEEFSEQIQLYRETEECWDEKDGTYIAEKCQKVAEHLHEIDAMLNTASDSWKTSRMGKADLTILRLAVYEMRYDDDIPVGVAINEAVELAKKYGSDGSASFINGILAELA